MPVDQKVRKLITSAVEGGERNSKVIQSMVESATAYTPKINRRLHPTIRDIQNSIETVCKKARYVNDDSV